MSDLLDRTLGERIRVEVDLAPDTWPTYVDPHQLENAIVNLAVNARDAMDGEGLMRIATENVTLAANEVGDVRAGEYVKISVTDTGCGMTPEVLDRAFEPFFTTKPVGKGTGLGLSQIFGFAHQSGGEVGIESEVGRGTTVSIYLPRTEAAAPVRIHPAVQRAETPTSMSPGARILLVEDDPRVRTATVGALEDLDYEPVACGSGAEAIDLFKAPGVRPRHHRRDHAGDDRPRADPALKATHERDFAVLFVTGYVGEGESDDLRGHELLRKPFTVGALASAVAAALARTLANRPAPQQPRQKADRGEQRVAPLPRLERDVRAGMAVDLPGDVVGAAGEGQARLGQAQRPNRACPSMRRQRTSALAASASRSQQRMRRAREPLVALADRHRRPMRRARRARRAARAE